MTSAAPRQSQPVPNDQQPVPYHFHWVAPAWRLVLLVGAQMPPGYIEADWRFTRARSVEDTNPDVRGQCDQQGFSLFKLDGTFADVAADAAGASGP